jgi:hypothetical protein
MITGRFDPLRELAERTLLAPSGEREPAKRTVLTGSL